jgi:hypothetical protein
MSFSFKKFAGKNRTWQAMKQELVNNFRENQAQSIYRMRIGQGRRV